ncbi:MAG TPA: serine hydrolase domain-containing protein [Candidatus Paceibacterota bacterium]|nr:serine hydrolase domain-containing protein [Candidatus Paceibacterota bacterium]
MDIPERISEAAERAIKEKVFPGCIVAWVRANGERAVLPFGRLTYDADAPLVREDTIYDLASVTKVLPTATLALMLLDQGRMHLEDKLADYLPEFANSDRENVRIKHLLTYSLDGYGLASAIWGDLTSKTAEDVIRTLLTRDFEKRPGTVFKYTNIPIALLGLALERVFGEPLDVSAEKYLLKPLGMERSTFFPETFPKEGIPPTEIDGWRGLVQGAVHDESAYVCKRDGKIMGHAGMFSAAPDILNFLEMYLHRGTFGGARLLSEEIMDLVEKNQIEELGDSMGLGWELNQPRFMGKFSSSRTFGKTGFTGTLVIVDRERGIAYTILSNRTYPKRPPDGAAINAFRAEIGEILLA